VARPWAASHDKGYRGRRIRNRDRWCLDGRPCPSRRGVVQANPLVGFGESPRPQVAPEIFRENWATLTRTTRVNLQQLLKNLASNVQTDNDTPLLMKAAEHMAIRFALERLSEG